MKSKHNLKMLLAIATALTVAMGSTQAQIPVKGQGKPGKGKSWKVFGNDKIDPNQHFLGPTDSVALIIKTNAQERIRTKADGDVIIRKNLCVEGEIFGADTLVVQGVLTADTIVISTISAPDTVIIESPTVVKNAMNVEGPLKIGKNSMTIGGSPLAACRISTFHISSM